MREGRVFETIIESIHNLKMPYASIKSPEMVKDVDTGRSREVDIGIRYKDVSDHEIFIAIECRDRIAVQDITWVEQLIAKKDSINADILLAVTASSFTKTAKIKAEKKGILLRHVEKIKPSEILQLTKDSYMEIHELKYCKVTKYDFKTENPEEITLNTQFFDARTNNVMSFKDLNNWFIETGILNEIKNKFKNINHNKTLQCCIVDKYPYFSIIDSDNNYNKVLETYIHIEATKIIDRLPLRSLLKYYNTTSEDQEGEYHKFSDQEEKSLVEYIKDTEKNKGKLIIDLSKRDNNFSIPIMILFKFSNPTILSSIQFK